MVVEVLEFSDHACDDGAFPGKDFFGIYTKDHVYGVNVEITADIGILVESLIGTSQRRALYP
jgi:hypothetical protein